MLQRIDTTLSLLFGPVGDLLSRDANLELQVDPTTNRADFEIVSDQNPNIVMKGTNIEYIQF